MWEAGYALVAIVERLSRLRFTVIRTGASVRSNVLPIFRLGGFVLAPCCEEAVKRRFQAIARYLGHNPGVPLCIYGACSSNELQTKLYPYCTRRDDVIGVHSAFRKRSARLRIA